MATRVLGKPVRNAASAGHRTSTKRMRNIRSMCPGIAWWEVNEVQISGNQIEPQWPFLDTLSFDSLYKRLCISRKIIVGTTSNDFC